MKPSGFDIIELLKNNYKPEAHDMKTPKMFFRYNGEDMSLVSVYNRNKKRRGRSRYLLSVMVDVIKDMMKMLLQMFRTMLTENTELSDEKISELVDAFINALPIMLKTQLQAA